MINPIRISEFVPGLDRMVPSYRNHRGGAEHRDVDEVCRSSRNKILDYKGMAGMD